MISHLDPSLHDPTPYPTLIHTSYPCQPTPHTQGIPSLSSPALLCAFFALPVDFRAPTTQFRLAPQPAPVRPPAFVPTPRRLGALSAVGALRRRRPALCARDVAPRFCARFAHILDFRHSQQVSPSPGDSRPPAITTPHPRKAWLTAVSFIIDLSPFDIVTCTRMTCARSRSIFDFGPQVRLSPTLSPFQNVADSLCIVHHPSFRPCRLDNATTASGAPVPSPKLTKIHSPASVRTFRHTGLCALSSPHKFLTSRQNFVNFLILAMHIMPASEARP